MKKKGDKLMKRRKDMNEGDEGNDESNRNRGYELVMKDTKENKKRRKIRVKIGIENKKRFENGKEGKVTH